ncbi:MAG: mechanosensitive ion channel [Bacteroidia bacterium]|nr:mechanosensitive ion channel [Bacteroidia bacterium]
MEKWEELLEGPYGDFIKPAIAYVPKILLALLLLVIGNAIINRVVKLIRKIINDRGLDESLKGFLGDMVNFALKAALIIAVLGIVGIETTSLVAVLGAAGLAVGLALQGSLSNFAGGVMILIFKPFKVGDLIQAQGHVGHVQEISIFVTKLMTPDNKLVIIPNGPLSNGDITNFSSLGKLRVDLVIGIGYNEDIKKAREVIMAAMKSDPKVLEDPAPSVSVLELADSSVNLAVRPYATPADYWDVYFGTYENAKIALDEAGIEIPFPQRVVHELD